MRVVASSPRRATPRRARVARDRARGASSRAARRDDDVVVERARDDARTDALSGGRFDDATLRTWESRAAWFYPRLTLVGSLALGLALSLPSSIGDAARSGGSAEATAALLENAGGLAACRRALAKADADKRRRDLERLQRELGAGEDGGDSEERVSGGDEVRAGGAAGRGARRGGVRRRGESGARFDRGDAVSTAVGTESHFSRARGRARARGRRRRPSRTSVRDGGELLKDVVKAFPGAGAGKMARVADAKRRLERVFPATDGRRGGVGRVPDHFHERHDSRLRRRRAELGRCC